MLDFWIMCYCWNNLNLNYQNILLVLFCCEVSVALSRTVATTHNIVKCLIKFYPESYYDAGVLVVG